jgi:Rrf2 family protein
MASWWRTNPVVVRRSLGKLREVGLVEAVTGPGGGWTLARSPESIPLADIYTALEERIFPIEPEPGTCVIEQEVHSMLTGTWERMEQELHAQLLGISLADLSSRIDPYPHLHSTEEIHSHA